MSEESWHLEQRVRFASWAVLDLPSSGEDRRTDDIYNAGHDSLLQSLRVGSESYRTNSEFLLSLSPGTLAMLCEVAASKKDIDPGLRDLTTEAASALSILCPIPNAKSRPPSPFGNAQVWAYHALFGIAEPLRMARLGRVVLGASWREIERDRILLDRLEEQLDVIRSHDSDTRAKCLAIQQLTVLCGTTAHWEQIEKILIHNQFLWPLLLDNNIGLSLPVALDLRPNTNGMAEVRTEHVGSLRIRWDLKRSASVAQALWNAKHRSLDRIVDPLRYTDLVFGFSDAECIASPLARVWSQISSRPLEIYGGSAQAYFSMAILRRLLGHSGIDLSAITGLIGDRLPRIDWQLAVPEGMDAKIRYVIGTRSFERAVIPIDHKTDLAIKAIIDHRKHAAYTHRASMVDVIPVYNIHGLADVVQIEGWRQYQYIRCPDVLWGIHSERRGRPGIIPDIKPRIQQIRHLLKENDAPILEVDASPMELTSALWHINAEFRQVMSWSVVRLLENETDTRFWHLVWRLIGREGDFQSFIRHPNHDAIVARLTTALNRHAPVPYSPNTPDVIVFIGGEKVLHEKPLMPASRPFYAAPIFRALSSRLEAQPDSKLKALIGNTRIIFIPTENGLSKVDWERPDIHMTQEEAIILRELSTFTYGFTRQTAMLMLDGAISDRNRDYTRLALESLIKRDILREGQGRCHIPTHVIELMPKTLKEHPSASARRHLRAGLSLVPYATDAEFPSLGIDVAFGPEYMHEAEGHFRAAFVESQRIRDETTQGLATRALQRLQRFSLSPSWGGVTSMLEAKNLPVDAHAMALRLLEWEDASVGVQHPQHLAFAARATRQLALATENEDTRKQLMDKAETFFAEALENVAMYPEEEDIVRLAILSEYAPFKHSRGEIAEFECMIDNVQHLLERNPAPALRMVVRGEFWELTGDMTRDHRAAALRYRLGLRDGPNVNQWNQLWVKALGAAQIGEDQETLDELAYMIEKSDPARILTKLNNPSVLRKITKFDSMVRQRWDTGLRIFDKMWRNVPQVHELFFSISTPPERGPVRRR